MPVLYDDVHRAAGTACRRNRSLARSGQIARAAFFTGDAADDKMEADKRKGDDEDEAGHKPVLFAQAARGNDAGKARGAADGVAPDRFQMGDGGFT